MKLLDRLFNKVDDDLKTCIYCGEKIYRTQAWTLNISGIRQDALMWAHKKTGKSKCVRPE